jgi:hypothetical protein
VIVELGTQLLDHSLGLIECPAALRDEFVRRTWLVEP